MKFKKLWRAQRVILRVTTRQQTDERGIQNRMKVLAVWPRRDLSWRLGCINLHHDLLNHVNQIITKATFASWRHIESFYVIDAGHTHHWSRPNTVACVCLSMSKLVNRPRLMVLSKFWEWGSAQIFLLMVHLDFSASCPSWIIFALWWPSNNENEHHFHIFVHTVRSGQQPIFFLFFHLHLTCDLPFHPHTIRNSLKGYQVLPLGGLVVP